MSGKKIEHPTPAEAFELATNHAALLRGLFLHPEFKYAQPPTADFVKPDTEKTPLPLLFVSESAQKTYVECVIPFLPAGATRKCKDIGNPWAWSDPNYKWEWEWDAQTSTLKDSNGNVQEFPKLPEKAAFEKISDVYTRGFIVGKGILENETDMKARLMIGGQTFDFGQEVRDLTNKTYKV
ncbi:uncharacterized protein F4822DRAFT_356590 [Hypoxylon trugodes]|uniref:uncharacterized protein n=1 Tax=Hypoxylon trugodes TaxID=326681 RepID=UPI002192896B|nr:uncharacterized protein F4822DRAFT_356590 [Hypoxylon trugodes]KAI1385868.1 hypothetical protein F4822DRAFT_356590 [Hypoxylon trugodes]